MTARRGTRTFRKKKGMTLWTALVVNGDNMATTAESSNIVTGTDWERGTTQSLQKATLKAIVGWIHITPLLSTVATWNYCVAKYDEDEASTDPSIVANYTTEDILFSWGGRNPAFAGDGRYNQVQPINIRTNRRIQSKDQIRLVRICEQVDVMEISCVLRALVQVS